ncbi:MAG TPA: FG-GAP repeat protein [Terriglobales bacterium]|nr:FG-GAP repeat protein [Terriglobales bacterium]
MQRLCAVVITGWLMASTCSAESPAQSQPLPIAMHAGISSRLGRDTPEYYAQPVDDGFAAEIPGRELNSHFTSRGVEVRRGDESWALSLRTYGYSTSLRPVRFAMPRHDRNRVIYERGPLTEWYLNGPAGLEQGFTLRQAPGKSGDQPLTITLALSGNVTAGLDQDGQGLTLTDRNGKYRWRYAGLRASDATGQELQAWLEVDAEQLVLHVRDAGARYPIVVDPIVQAAELTEANGSAYDTWGYSVAISGTTVVVGWPNATVNSHHAQGAVYVFVMPPTGWANMTPTAVLTASDGLGGDSLGSSVAVNGQTIVAGAAQASVGRNPNQGAGYVFVQPSGGWVNMTQNAKLLATDGVEFSGLGFSTAIAGNTVVLGAPLQLGAVYVYNRPGGGWSGKQTQTAELTGSGTDVYGLGNSVSINGSTIAAGAQQSTINSNFEQGAVYIFTKPSGGWVNANQNAELTASDGSTFDHLGYAVVVSGSAVIAGAPNAEINSNLGQGADYVFVEPAGGWGNMTETAKLTASDGAADDSFGSSLALYADNVLLSGAPGATIGSNAAQGAIYMFLRPQTGWQTTSQFYSKVTPVDGVANGQFGTGVALNAGVGVSIAPGATVGSNLSQGAAYVFQKQP